MNKQLLALLITGISFSFAGSMTAAENAAEPKKEEVKKEEVVAPKIEVKALVVEAPKVEEKKIEVKVEAPKVAEAPKIEEKKIEVKVEAPKVAEAAKVEEKKCACCSFVSNNWKWFAAAGGLVAVATVIYAADPFGWSSDEADDEDEN